MKTIPWHCNPILRSVVFELIDEEREYQKALPTTRTTNDTHEVGAYLAMIQCYLNEGLVGWTKTGSDYLGLCAIRKIAALSVRCMEENGCPSRASEMEATGRA
jgi:hypothetical protein